MEYAKGRIGRVFTVRIDYGDDLILELIKLAELERIESAVFVLLGALKEAKFVAGPKENVIPPEPVWSGFDDAHEILGIGNIFLMDGKPKIHLHAGAGRGDNVKLGCLRGESEVFMVVEAFVFELEGFSARRITDEEQGFAPLVFEQVSDLK
ncbi:DNA-binding protein with PD1-like DNA-binding motif [Methanosarcina spelaei]|uniref:DNA-binding protein with PD1-like DNA-binding motif n=1 Tax=Methanosarcina spelaei TaxID=1036679 RepID=A0A2A2HR55_9EURY|nr:PPC domain-containing DNA-binding protein [Methanosarcina spelaei]PAV11852.1 DNA-binding protein with PD1-like DNA-binding motif [Methanosarcina spelaei]